MNTPLSALLATLLLAASTIAPPAEAQTKSFRCRNDLVNLGDDKASALLKCGEPVVRDSFCNPLATVVTPQPARPWMGQPGVPVLQTGCTTVDEWTYNPGYGQFMTTLRFESGRLAEIRYGDRVK